MNVSSLRSLKYKFKHKSILWGHIYHSNTSQRRLASISTKIPLKHITVFEQLVGRQNLILSDEDTFGSYTTDWTNSFHGGGVVLFPKDTNEVSNIMKYCHSEGLSIVPQGGNTGLCGGSVGVADEVILSLKRMNRVHNIDEDAMAVVCDAGCVLQTLNEEVSKKGFIVPLDLGKINWHRLYEYSP
jgi:FAD/FMN-containing dehydrogenase